MRISRATHGFQLRHLLHAVLLVALGFGLALCQHVAAAGEEPGGPSAAEVRQALKAFAAAVKSKDPSERVVAVRALGAVRHEKVALRLLKFVTREREETVLAAAFEVLGRQSPDVKKLVPTLAKRLAEEAGAEARRMARGDAGFRIDPRTGEADLYSVEGRARLEAAERRAGMLAALLEALAALEKEPSGQRPDITPFLQSPSDALVVGTLRRLGAWRAWSALPAMLALFRMYPTAATWETGAVVDLGGTDATAKARWMVFFGHPDKQRARPDVHAALAAALKAVAGEAFDSPEALAAYLKRAEVQARVEGKGTRRRTQ